MRPSSLHLAPCLLLLAATASAGAQAQEEAPTQLHTPTLNPHRRHRAEDLSWLWQYAEPAPVGRENELVADSNFRSFLKANLTAPQSFWGTEPLADVAREFLSVPGSVLADSNRYLSIDGCVPHFCPDRGLLWIDTGTQQPLTVFAAIDWIQDNRATTEPGSAYTPLAVSVASARPHPSSRCPHSEPSPMDESTELRREGTPKHDSRFSGRSRRHTTNRRSCDCRRAQHPPCRNHRRRTAEAMSLRCLTLSASMRQHLVATFAGCLALPLASPKASTRATPQSDAAWVRTFAAPYTLSRHSGVGDGASLNWDPRFSALLASSFPQRQWFWFDHNRLVSTADLVHTFLGATGDTILDGNRYVTIDGCVRHVCDVNRGMLWIDAASHPADLIFVATNLIGGDGPTGTHLWLFSSSRLNWQHLPPSFLTSLSRWLNIIGKPGYNGTAGYRFHFVIATIVQPSGTQEDLSPRNPASRNHRNRSKAMTSTPRTMFEKVWGQHLVTEPAGEPALLYIDLHLVHEVTSPQAFEGLRLAGRQLRRPDRHIATVDHNVPTSSVQDRLLIADDISARQVDALRRNCRDFGVEFFDVQDAAQGIVHMIGPELGATKPGMTIVCGDSHTSTHGAFGALAFGIGTSEVEHVMATQTLPQSKPKTFRINVEGDLPFGVTAKDIILDIIGRIGTDGATGYVVEYAGSAIRALSMEGRMTICNMSIEAGARAGMIAPRRHHLRLPQGPPLLPVRPAAPHHLRRRHLRRVRIPHQPRRSRLTLRPRRCLGGCRQSLAHIRNRRRSNLRPRDDRRRHHPRPPRHLGHLPRHGHLRRRPRPLRR